ncbi:cytochrome P450 6k1-like [Zootermopsis nevadensis]|uniref:cytochrome P450 6k1-like n=1 Tax=Zootermopsis nevadensis TaxID=136037 RepID=UPI000B8EA1FA|nr:cytochrome P450 6k1-like [Zootermopsis nevadensis]
MLDIPFLQLWVTIATILTTVYVYFRVSFLYWKKRGVPTLNPTAPFGDFGKAILTKKSFQQVINEFYNDFDGQRFGGVYSFSSPALLIRDPEIIKAVLVKDFNKFHSHGIITNEEVEPLQGNLFALSGSKWRNLRVKLSPTFTSGKMKMMFGTMVDCGKELQTFLQEPANNKETIEVKDILARFSTDIIASCAFGIQCNCLKNPDAEFRIWGRKIFEPTFSGKILRTITFLLPSSSRFFRSSFLSKGVTDYFMKMVKETVEYREKNDVKRNDFMQLMIQLKNKTLGVAEEDNIKLGNLDADETENNAPFEITVNVIAAQAFVFFLAGFETSSTTMTFCLYELALNPDIQERLRAEIDTVVEKHDGNITYESIFEMEYLDKVVDETLRKYPPATTIRRECTKSVKLHGTDVLVEKGTKLLFPIMAIHHDPKYYPDPERFDPERFSEVEKKKRPHFTYLPFGEGPRICIGMRFGLMQTKVGIVSFLSKYEVRVSQKTPIPLEFDHRSLVLAPLGGMWLDVVKRNDA